MTCHIGVGRLDGKDGRSEYCPRCAEALVAALEAAP